MEEKELIIKIKALGQIKPREDWVVLVKSQILRPSLGAKNNVFENNVNKLTYKDVLSNILRVFFQRKFAYALAVFLLAIVGFFGLSGVIFNKKGSNKVSVNNTPVISLEIKSNLEDFKEKSKNLAEMSKHNSLETLSVVIKEVKSVAVELANAIKKDPQLARAVALDINNNKTYLDIQGADDLKETSDTLYKTIDEQMIRDLENTTLTEGQQKTLEVIKNLYEEEKYASALESILLLNVAMQNN